MAKRKRKTSTKTKAATKPAKRKRDRKTSARKSVPKKKLPASAVTPTRASRAPGAPRVGHRAAKVSPKKRGGVKRKRARLAKPKKRQQKVDVFAGKPARPRKAALRKRRLSTHPEAVRSRKRRAEARGVAEAKAAEREERRRNKKIIGGGHVDERTLAIEWLETIRNDIAAVFEVSLSLTEPEVGARTPWLVVGRFDPVDEITYAELAAGLEVVRDDVLLEASIHPQRLSQLRVVYADPHAKRGEGDSIVSKTGAWEFIVSDLIGELIGPGATADGDYDPDCLAARYSETTVPVFYVYFSSEIINYKTSWPEKAATIQMR